MRIGENTERCRRKLATTFCYKRSRLKDVRESISGSFSLVFAFASAAGIHQPFAGEMTWVVGVASAGSLCAIFVSLVSIGVIVNDISSLQDEVHEGMTEFRVSVRSYSSQR